MNPLMQFRGEPVDIMTRDGVMQRGIIAGGDPAFGIFFATSFGMRFIPFVLIVAAFSVRFRRRIF